MALFSRALDCYCRGWPLRPEPKQNIFSLNQLWDLIDWTDFLVGLRAIKKWSPSFNAPWIKRARRVHTTLNPPHKDSTFVANEGLTRKEWKRWENQSVGSLPAVFSSFSVSRVTKQLDCDTEQRKPRYRRWFPGCWVFRDGQELKGYDKLLLGVKWSVRMFAAASPVEVAVAGSVQLWEAVVCN